MIDWDIEKVCVVSLWVCGLWCDLFTIWNPICSPSQIPSVSVFIAHTHIHTQMHTHHISPSIFPAVPHCAIFSVLQVSYPLLRHRSVCACVHWSMQNVPASRDKLPSFIFPEDDPSIEEKGRQSSKWASASFSLIFPLHKLRDDLSVWRNTLDQIYSSVCEIIWMQWPKL